MSVVEKLFSVVIRMVLLGAFASFLLASIHHFATFFHNFEPSSVDMTGPYALAFSIDGTALVLTIGVMFFSSRMLWPAKVLIWTFIILLTGFSWVVNWEYAQVYQGATFNKLDPFWQTLNPILASSFAFLNLAYSIIAEVFNTKEKTEAELRAELSALTGEKAELIKQIRAAKGPGLIARATEAAKELKKAAGEVLTSDQSAPETEQKPEAEQQPAAPEIAPAAAPLSLPQPMTEKLKLALDFVKNTPNGSDEDLAEILGLNRAASARFWRLKAVEILTTNGPLFNQEPEAEPAPEMPENPGDFPQAENTEIASPDAPESPDFDQETAEKNTGDLPTREPNTDPEIAAVPGEKQDTPEEEEKQDTSAATSSPPREKTASAKQQRYTPAEAAKSIAICQKKGITASEIRAAIKAKNLEVKADGKLSKASVESWAKNFQKAEAVNA